MGPQVILKQLALDEGQSTDRADVGRRPAVDLLVSPQCSGSREALAADIAAVRFDSRVASHVRLHVLKHLPADLTGPATADTFSVGPEMVEQTI